MGYFLPIPTETGRQDSVKAEIQRRKKTVAHTVSVAHYNEESETSPQEDRRANSTHTLLTATTTAAAAVDVAAQRPAWANLHGLIITDCFKL